MKAANKEWTEEQSKNVETRRQANGIRNGSQHRKEQDHDQQKKEHQCGYKQERPVVRGGFKYLGATLCKDGTCSAKV